MVVLEELGVSVKRLDPLALLPVTAPKAIPLVLELVDALPERLVDVALAGADSCRRDLDVDVERARELLDVLGGTLEGCPELLDVGLTIGDLLLQPFILLAAGVDEPRVRSGCGDSVSPTRTGPRRGRVRPRPSSSRTTRRGTPRRPRFQHRFERTGRLSRRPARP